MRLGTCKQGHGGNDTPIKTDKTNAIAGAYSALVNQSQTMLMHGAHHEVVADFHTDAGSAVVRTFGNTLYWMRHPDTYNYTLASMKDGVVMEYGFKLTYESDLAFYAASEDVIVTGAMGGEGSKWSAYRVGAANDLMSTVTILQGSSMVEFWPRVVGKTAFVFTKYTMVTPEQLRVHVWNVEDSNPVPVIHNVTIPGCLYPNQKADTVNKGDWEVFCADDTATACTVVFVARSGESGGGHLCSMDLSDDTVTPLVNTPKYVLADDVMFFESGVVYSAYTGTTRVQPGDVMVYLYGDKSYHWVNDEMLYDVDYCYAPAFVNFHLPDAGGVRRWALYNSTLVYSVTPGFGTRAFFSYDLASGVVTPLGLPFAVPNTRCNYYTYGSICDENCVAETLNGFIRVWPLANGSVVLETATNTDGTITDSLRQLDPQVCPGGCSATGGTCVSGTCHCVAGCTGRDCTGGAAFCSQASIDC